MRVHRFYVGDDLALKKDFWVHDEALLWQWGRVLRFQPGQELILFDGSKSDRLYRLAKLEKTEAHLQMITELERVLPVRHIYLFWSLLKKDNNEQIIQKCTEIGVSNFVPIISDRTIKKDFNFERARKIALEASEQCGRSNIPIVREPLHLEKALKEYSDKIELLVCHEGSSPYIDFKSEKYGLFIGPEGGWSEPEQKMFSKYKVPTLGLGQLTLRAETAAIVGSAKLLV